MPEKPKTIGMILDKYYPPDPRVENEAQRYIEDGYVVKLWCIDLTGKLPLKETIMGIEVHRIRLSKLKYKFSALAYTIPVYRWILTHPIKKFLQENAIDIIHVHDMQIAETVLSANKELNLPLHLDLHEDRPEIMKFYPHIQEFPGKWLIKPSQWAKAQIDLVKRADTVIVVTEEAKERLVSISGISPDKVRAIPNLPHPDFFNKAVIKTEITDRFKEGRHLLYLGDTGLRRGLDTALQALKLLHTEFPDLKLIIVGSSRDDQKLKQLAQELQVENLVYFEGWQDQGEFPSYIVASDIGLSPLHRNAHHDTTYANKIFQYMAFNLPVVVSDCPAQANVIRKENSGLVHKASDPQDLADKIRSILNHTWQPNKEQQ
jgi:glycosyltransferase involved in cell wall biosynthesis